MSFAGKSNTVMCNDISADPRTGSLTIGLQSAFYYRYYYGYYSLQTVVGDKISS